MPLPSVMGYAKHPGVRDLRSDVALAFATALLLEHRGDKVAADAALNDAIALDAQEVLFNEPRENL